MTWPLVTTPATIDTGFLNGVQSITVNTAVERTSQAVVDQYTSYINTIQAVLNASPPTDTAAQQLVAAMDGLRTLALNGIVGPPILAGGPQVTYMLTNQMAQQVDMLSRTLRAAGIFEDDATTINASHVGTWQDLATQGLNTIVQNAQFAAVNNSSFQAMIELQYVQTGTNVLGQQLTDLGEALKATQSATDLLGQLQQIHNYIAPSPVNTNAILAFSDPAQLAQNNQQAIFNLLAPEAQEALGITSPSDITPTLFAGTKTFTFGNQIHDPLAFGPIDPSLANLDLGIVNNIMWRLTDPLWGNNGLNPLDPTTLQNLKDAHLISVDGSGNPILYGGSYGYLSQTGVAIFTGLNGSGPGGPAPTPGTANAAQTALFNLLTPDQRVAIAKSLVTKGYNLTYGNTTGELAPEDITASTITAFNSATTAPTVSYVGTGTPNISTAIYDSVKVKALGAKFALMEQAYLAGPGSPEHISGQQMYNVGIGLPGPTYYSSSFNPDFNLASVRIQVAQLLTPSQQAIWGITLVHDHNGNVIDASINEPGSPSYQVVQQAGLGSNIASISGGVNKGWSYFWAPIDTDAAINGIQGNLTGTKLTASRGILASLLQSQKATLGIVSPTMPALDPNASRNSSVSQYNSVSQGLYGNPITSIVDFKGQNEDTVFAKFESIRTQIAALITKLDQLSPGSSSDPSSLAGHLKQVLQDIQDKVGDTTADPVGAIAGFEAWIIDNGNNSAGPGGSGATSQTPSNDSGVIQTNIQNAITAASNLNDKQKQDFNSDMFVFQQFYQSASAMLTTLTQIIEKMAQNAGR